MIPTRWTKSFGTLAMMASTLVSTSLSKAATLNSPDSSK